MPDVNLSALTVLILEDDALLSMLLEDMVTSLGCKVAGPFMRVSEAMRYLQDPSNSVNGAILDVNVAGEESFPIAHALSQSRIPFAFSTGYGRVSLEANWDNALQLGKPFTMTELENVLEKFSIEKNSVERV